MDTTNERITGLRLELTTTVGVPPPALWTTIVDVPGIGAWSPECLGARWLGGATAAAPGARFAAENRFADDRGAVVLAAEGVVTDVDPHRVFGWSMLDDHGLVGSRWRYELSPAGDGTVVRHSWEHGPGTTGMRLDALADPPSVDRRLGTLARHMHATLVAMELHALAEVA